MELIFLQRYEELITTELGYDTAEFLGEIDYTIIKKIARVLLAFREPVEIPVSRYDSITEKTDALIIAVNRLDDVLGYNATSSFSAPGFEYGIDSEEDNLARLPISWLFSLIEILFDELSVTEKEAFRSAINEVFSDNDIPWVLIDGRMVKIDSKQFEQDMKRKAAERLNELKNTSPVFQSSYDELTKAIEFLNKGDYAEAVTNAAKSYESALKVLCNKENAAAGTLVSEIGKRGLLDLPDGMEQKDFESKVLMSLPFIRNRPGAAHGAGAGTGEISRNMANLAVNLACALDTYIADEWAFGQQNDID